VQINQLTSMKMQVFDTFLKSKRRIVGVVFALILLIALPVSLFLIQQSQDTRQRASGPTAPAGPTFTLTPQEILLSVGQSKEVQVKIVTNNALVGAYMIEVPFPTNILKIECISTNTCNSDPLSAIGKGMVRMYGISVTPIQNNAVVAKLRITRLASGTTTVIPKVVECATNTGDPLVCLTGKISLQSGSARATIVPSPTIKASCFALLRSSQVADTTRCNRGLRGQGMRVNYSCSDGFTSFLTFSTCQSQSTLTSLAKKECEKRKVVCR